MAAEDQGILPHNPGDLVDAKTHQRGCGSPLLHVSADMAMTQRDADIYESMSLARFSQRVSQRRLTYRPAEVF